MKSAAIRKGVSVGDKRKAKAGRFNSILLSMLLAAASLTSSQNLFAQNTPAAGDTPPAKVGPVCGATVVGEAKVEVAAQPPAETIAELQALVQMQEEAPDTYSTVLGERHSLQDFISPDPAKNLVLKAPLNVMNAAQRMLALVYSQGVKKRYMPLTGDEVEFYPFFSSGVGITKGARVIGNEKAIAEFVRNLKAQALGDRSGSSIILLVAGPGTGKSETLKLLGVAAENLTAQPDSKFAVYTFTWTGLGKIPGLHRFIPSTTIEGKQVFADIEAPLGDSPYTLLPEEYQRAVLSSAKAGAMALIDGMAPTPFAQPDRWSQFIRNEIIQHYATTEKKRPLKPSEIVEVLSRHVVVKRQVLGQSHGKMPLIDAQGNDIDVAGLFMTPNPIVRFASGVGPTHPMAWFLNGKILQGHGNAVLLDEWPRNPKEFRNMTLGAFESRVLTVGGAPSVPFDSVMIAAGNTASLDALAAEEAQTKTGQAASNAGVNRFRLTPMRWSAFPGEVAQLLLYGKQANLFQQSLTKPGAPVEAGVLDELVPMMEKNTRQLTPDGRYRVWFGEGTQRVMAAPHVIMTMAEIVAASRMETNPERAKQVHSGKITTSHLFRSPLERLRLYEGLKPAVRPSEIRELADVTMLLKEGESGITHRDAMRWFSGAIEAAKSSRSGGTLTPGVLLKTFRDMLNEGSIVAPSNKVRLEWLELAKEVVSQILIPRLASDISRALANGDEIVHKAYYDILDEALVLKDDPEARSYESSQTGQERPIDRERLAKVKEIYARKNGQPLNLDQIAVFHGRQRIAGSGGRGMPDERLVDAVAEYYSQLNTQLSGIASLVEFERTGDGTDEVRAAHSSLVKALEEMGYNRMAIRDALMLVNEQRSRNEAPPPN